jgi:hypothetical protein
MAESSLSLEQFLGKLLANEHAERRSASDVARTEVHHVQALLVRGRRAAGGTEAFRDLGPPRQLPFYSQYSGALRTASSAATRSNSPGLTEGHHLRSSA